MQTFVFLIFLFLGFSAAEVLVLDSKNFEHLTQASTGSTTGDWLVKFYAPWCGHCKKLNPVYEQVAEALKGEINVAKVDVTANREIGTRFEIKGFPTIKLLRKGKVYTFKGRRTVDDLVEFARGGFETYSAEEIQPPVGVFGEIGYIYRHAYKQAVNDLKNGRLFTVDVFLVLLPLIFLVLLGILIFLPASTPTPRRVQELVQEKENTGDQNDNKED
jgi:protein disulfide-isomerase-like protein|mmetsp:Transcript_9280/g.10015  ORF Transcript_9280/g.10015 Transcript_9280/m.10015 type:complete len:217 (+) Transcript_9280:40-690(+)